MRISVVANGRPHWVRDIREALARQTARLTLSVEIEEWTGTMPVRCGLVIYLGNYASKRSHTDEGLRTILGAGVPILPVLERAPSAPHHLPKDMLEKNAFLCKPHAHSWPDALVEETLSRLWIGRLARKVFLSYLRKDSAACASALHHRFVRLGYDTFLDECSIQHGEEFQKELHNRLNDSDIFVLLASPNFTSSKWVMKEIEFAKTSMIGGLAVIWPSLSKKDRRPPNIQAVLERFPRPDQMHLDAADFTKSSGGRSLTRVAVDRIVHRAGSARVGGLIRRMESLLPLARAELSNKGSVKPGTRPGDLLFSHATEGRSFVRVLPFRPAVEQVHALWTEVGAEPKAPEKVGCFYDENDPYSAPVAALDWAIAERSSAARPPAVSIWGFDARRPGRKP